MCLNYLIFNLELYILVTLWTFNEYLKLIFLYLVACCNTRLGIGWINLCTYWKSCWQSAIFDISLEITTVYFYSTFRCQLFFYAITRNAINNYNWNYCANICLNWIYSVDVLHSTKNLLHNVRDRDWQSYTFSTFFSSS